MIKNPEGIKEFEPNSKLCKKIEKICAKYELEIEVQIYRGTEKSEYRGSTFENVVTLYWSHLETTDSMFWVFCHELRHVIIAKNPELYQVIEKQESAITEALSHKKLRKMTARKAFLSLYRTGMTETICDIFATEIVGKDYGDLWYAIRFKREKKNEQRN